jgi:outer membrane receptor protein involved in Fe transport
LDTLGTKLKLYYNYNNNNRYSNSLFNSENYNGDLINLFSSKQNKNNIDNNFNINAFGADIETTIYDSKIEIGIKYTNYKNDNDLKFYDSTSGSDILDTSISNFFKYNEKLFATYLNFSINLNEKIYLTTGLRYEFTNIEGTLVTQNITNKNDYGNLFPNISFSYDPNDNNSFSLSYNKRISRPGLYDLNPFRIYSDANNYEVGNPNLLPNITDNVELGYVYKGNFSFTVYSSKISNNWAYIVSSENNNNIIVTQPKNVLTTYDIGSEIAYNWKINSSISNYSSTNVSYQKSNSSDTSLNDNDLKGFRGTISSNTTITLNKDKTNKLFINMFYNTPGVEEMYISKNTFIFRVGTSLSFLSKKLNINAYLTDPFNTTIARNTVNFDNFQFKNRIFNDNRSFNLSVVYKFGNNKSKNNDRKVDNSEKDRLIKDK